MSNVAGEICNPHIELFDVISNVVYYSNCFKNKESTLGSVKRAVDNLTNPIISYFLFLSLLFNLSL